MPKREYPIELTNGSMARRVRLEVLLTPEDDEMIERLRAVPGWTVKQYLQQSFYLGLADRIRGDLDEEERYGSGTPKSVEDPERYMSETLRKESP